VEERGAGVCWKEFPQKTRQLRQVILFRLFEGWN